MKAMKTKATLPTCKMCQKAKCLTMRAILCPKCFAKSAASSGSRSSGNASARGSVGNDGNASARGSVGNEGNIITGKTKKSAGKRSWLKRQAKDLLVVKRHWLELILRKKKSWEIRGKGTSKRGLIHLAASGGGGLILGRATLVDCLPVEREELRRHTGKHCIPERELESVKYPKIYAWVLKGACRYKVPLEHKHSQGAVVWVKSHRWFA